MSDYFQHWLNIGKRLEDDGAVLPKIYCVNWFRKDENGKFIWPGFGENMRVLSWILSRAEGKANGIETPFGICPEHNDIEWNGLDYSAEKFAKAIHVAVDDWKNELKLHTELFEHLGDRLPKEMKETRSKIEQRLNA
jgi:phosphoenolpyruvate carboxykinase (GTP)